MPVIPRPATALSPVAAAAFSPAIFASAPAGESRGDLAGLDDGEQAILLLGFNGDLTRAEIGRQLGISQMQVSQLLSQAFGYLRACLLARSLPASRPAWWVSTGGVWSGAGVGGFRAS